MSYNLKTPYGMYSGVQYIGKFKANESLKQKLLAKESLFAAEQNGKICFA